MKRALEAGCPREYVAQLTGHKNASSLQNYIDADVGAQKAMCSSVQTGAPFKIADSAVQIAPAANSSVTNITFNISSCENVTVTNK